MFTTRLTVFPDSRRYSSRTPQLGSDPEQEFIPFFESGLDPEQLPSGLLSTVSIVHNKASYCVNERDIDITVKRETNSIPLVPSSAPASTIVNAEPTTEPAPEPVSADILSAIGNP